MSLLTPHRIAHGGDYNPDQWLNRPEILDEDIRLMQKAGVNFVSLGIFAWAQLEPEEGRYEFGWLDECFQRLHDGGIGILLATPTAARPLWMAHAYPEVRITLKDGTLEPIGRRHNFCWSSPVYREKSAAIITRLAERYGKHPGLIGWHINNEYGGSYDAARCYCPRCIEGFQNWLRKRYNNDLEALNHAWWTSFWAHAYQSWEQILPCDATVEGLMLNWWRYCAEKVADFMVHEIKHVRQHSEAPVIHNLHGFGSHVDESLLAPHLDYLGYDAYPNIDGSSADIASMTQVAFDTARMRGLKPSTPWLLMESCPAQPQYKLPMRAKRPGVHRQLSLQTIAGGSDMVGYFQWRAGRGGMEKLHGAVLMQDGPTDTRVFREVAELGHDLESLSGLAGMPKEARVAVVWDVEQQWAWWANNGLKGLPDPRERAIRWFSALWQQGIDADVVPQSASLDRYDLILAPSLFLLRNGFAEKLRQAVERGATVVADALAGWVDPDMAVPHEGRPGRELRDLFGVQPEELDCLRADETRILAPGDSRLPKVVQAQTFCDCIHVTGARPLAHYTEDYYDGWAAITSMAHGHGEAIYLATDLSDSALRTFLLNLTAERDIQPAIPNLSTPILATSRKGLENEFVFLSNPTPEPHHVALPAGMCHLDGRPVQEPELPLRPWECVVLKQPLAGT